MKAKFGDVDAYYISLDDLVRNKLATGREQYKLDAKILIGLK